MFRQWHALARHVGGHAILEFAIVAPVLLLLLMGTVEYAMVMFASAVLEGATNYAARVGQTGYYVTSNNGATCAPTTTQVANDTPIQLQSLYVVCMAGERVKGIFDITKLQLTATDYGGYSSSDSPVTTTCSNSASATSSSNPPSCSSLQSFGNAGDVIVYTLTYPWNIVTPFLQGMLGKNGIVMLSSSAVVKNEPYSTSSR
jgi:Flp pilus assembly protein TadG